jgi:NADPH-dependent 2,4-dienoyl-CoA reductase/sulfur reductase-like enzyme
MSGQGETLIIVGAGHAGGRAALTLREEGYAGRLVLIGDELHLPYERPPLSKGLLQGSAELAHFSLCDAQRVDELAIEHVPGNPALKLDSQARRLQLADGRTLEYSALLLATGGKARRLPGVSPALTNVLYLRTHDEALALRSQLQPGARLVVVGGGFIGLEVAATGRALGCRVTLLEAADRLAARVLPPRVSDALLALHREQGVDIRLGAQLQSVEGRERAEAVVLADGSRIPCDLLVVGIGMLPNTELAVRGGLAVGQGIQVDSTLRTSAEAVYAAGDVCEYRLKPGGAFQRQETWRNAEAQGRHAALNMLGRELPFMDLPAFWSDQFDAGLQTVGSLHNAAPSASRELPGGSFLLFYLDGQQRLRGVCGWAQGSSIGKDIKLCERLILDGKPLSAAALADSAVSLKQLLRG